MSPLVNSIDNLLDTDQAQRLFHGRGGLYQGLNHLCLDWFPEVLLLTSFKVLSEQDKCAVIEAVSEKFAHRFSERQLNLVYQCRASGESTTQLICGEVPAQHIVREGPCRYQVQLMSNQNHGLFLDMAKGRQWLFEHAKSANVLNLFAYTCAFSCVALTGAAKSVVNIDMSRGALKVGQQNHQLNGIERGARFLSHDIFKSWGKLKKFGGYDIIVADPPSFQKGSFIATKDYPKLIRRLPELMNSGGYLLLCLNAPDLGSAFIKEQVTSLAPKLTFIERIANPEVFADIDPERSLKVLLYRFDD
ncbi:class I SAM-dependent methyltransferase [Paraferrimonas haliotis]|uniref:class I SAM-dependent methyltransferase n=1 Tax=Paraferrimonas haliotis TaxID=2013866 RepID=UPI0038CD7C06